MTVTAVEVWLLSCIFFIFTAFLEYGMVLFLNNKNSNNNNNKGSALKESERNIGWKKNSKPKVFSEKLDRIFAIGSVFSFGIFNLIFWIVYY